MVPLFRSAYTSPTGVSGLTPGRLSGAQRARKRPQGDVGASFKAGDAAIWVHGSLHGVEAGTPVGLESWDQEESLPRLGSTQRGRKQGQPDSCRSIQQAGPGRILVARVWPGPPGLACMVQGGEGCRMKGGQTGGVVEA